MKRTLHSYGVLAIIGGLSSTLVFGVGGESRKRAVESQGSGEAGAAQGGDATPDARPIYDRMVTSLKQHETLYYRSAHRWSFGGKEVASCSYEVWLRKPNAFRIESADADGEPGAVMIGDGRQMWVHWPHGRPLWEGEDADLPISLRRTQFLQKRAGAGQHSIAHEHYLFGVGMHMPPLDPSMFHGYTPSIGTTGLPHILTFPKR